MVFGKVYQFKALCFGLSAAPLVFTRSWRLTNSGVLPGAGSSFSEDGPPVVQLFRDSRQLGEVSACVASEYVLPRGPIGLSVSGLLQPRTESTGFSQLAPCFYHAWINM